MLATHGKSCVGFGRMLQTVSTRAFAAKSSKRTDWVQTSVDEHSIMTIEFNNGKKLNAWTMGLLNQLTTTLAAAAKDESVAGVIITGKGKYYSAGVDLSAMIKPMAPSKLVKSLRDKNQHVFGMFLDFPKPIVAAVNGPAIGAAVTSTILMDHVVAAENATFNVPFVKLGVPAEGCSSKTFPERMGDDKAQKMLGPDNWQPTGTEAFEAGLIDEVCKTPEEALARARELLKVRIEEGGNRRFDAKEYEELRRVNAIESAAVANAFVSKPFLAAMQKFNNQRKKSQLERFFQIAKVTLPIWQPKAIDANHDFPNVYSKW